MNRVLLIDRAVNAAVEHVLEYARLHPYTMDDLLDMQNKQKEPPGNNPNHVVNIPFGVRVVYTHEYQNPGLCKHLSISVDTPGKMPSVGVVSQIMKLFKMESELYDCQLNIENIGPNHQAISVIEPPNNGK